jgi:hypothetical protein
LRFDTRDRPSAWHGALDGAGNVERSGTAGLSWPLPEDMSDGALEAALYASRRSKRGHLEVDLGH